jgi:hypothetical protein
MSEFNDRWGHLTVGEALALNKIAEETCWLEATAHTGGDDGSEK